MDDIYIEDLGLEAPSQYRYFDRWYRFELAVFILFGPAIVSLWSVTAWYYYHSDRLPAPILKPAIYFTVAFLFVRIFYRNFSAIARAKSIVIGDETVSKRSAAGISVFKRADISRARKPKHPFARRWLILESLDSKESFKLPVYVRNGHKMVDRIFRIIADKRPLSAGAAAMRDELYKAAKRYNILQKLRAKQMHNMFRAAGAVALLNMAAVLVYWERGMLMALCWGAVNMFLQAEAYFIVERLHYEKILKSGKTTDGETPFTAYYILAGIGALLVGMAIGIFVTEPA